MGPILAITLSLFIFYAGESACSAQDGCLAGGDTSSAKFVQTKLHTLQEEGVPSSVLKQTIFPRRRRRAEQPRGVVATGEHAQNCRPSDRRRNPSRRRASTFDFCRCRRRSTGCPPIRVEGVPVNGDGQPVLVHLARRRASSFNVQRRRSTSSSFNWVCGGSMESSTIHEHIETLQVTYYTGLSPRRRNGRIWFYAQECGPSPAPTPAPPTSDPTPVPTTPPTAPFANCAEVAADPNDLCLIDGIGSGQNQLCGLSCDRRRRSSLIESGREGSDESGQGVSDESDPELSDTEFNVFSGTVLRVITADGNEACNVHEDGAGNELAQQEQCIESAMFAAMQRWSDLVEVGDYDAGAGLMNAVEGLDRWTKSMPLNGNGSSRFPDYELAMGVCNHLLELAPFGGLKPLNQSEQNLAEVHHVRWKEIYNCGDYSCVPNIPNETLDKVATIFHPTDEETNTWQECKFKCDAEQDCYGFQMTCNLQCIHFHQACEVTSVSSEGTNLVNTVETWFANTYNSNRCSLYPSYVMKRKQWWCYPTPPMSCTGRVTVHDPQRLVGQARCTNQVVSREVYLERQAADHYVRRDGSASNGNLEYRARPGPSARRRYAGDDLPCAPCADQAYVSGGYRRNPASYGQQLTWQTCLYDTNYFEARADWSRQFWIGLADRLRDPQSWLDTTQRVVAGVDKVLNDGLNVFGLEMPFGISLGDILGCIPAFKGASLLAQTSRMAATAGGLISDVGSAVDLYTDVVSTEAGGGDPPDGFSLGTTPTAAGLVAHHQTDKTWYWSGYTRYHPATMPNPDPLTRGVQPNVANPRVGKPMKVWQRGIPCIGVLTKFAGAGLEAAQSGRLPDGPEQLPSTHLWG